LLARSKTSSSFFLVFSGVGDQHAGRGETRIIATEHGNGQGALRKLDQLFKTDPDPLLEGLGRIFKPYRHLFAKIFEAGVVPELAILAPAERLAERFHIVELEQKKRGVGKHSLRRCRGLSLVRGQTRHAKKSQPSDEGQATNRPLRQLHVRKLHFQAPLGLTRGVNQPGRR